MSNVRQASKAEQKPSVVIPFHDGDQFSAALLIENILSLDDGFGDAATYYLHYGDDLRTLKIRSTIDRLAKSRRVILSNEVDRPAIPQAFIDSDPNSAAYDGLHTIRTPAQKSRILEWNLVVLNFIEKLDAFLIVEPDCLILKPNWLREIWDAYDPNGFPISGHLKHGKIGGQLRPTHYAGCSIYNGAVLRTLPLRKFLAERFDNPWWPLRLEANSEMAGNVFWGPAFSGYDISFDYFLYTVCQIQRTKSSQPLNWPTRDLPNLEQLIFCDFRSRLTINEIEQRHFGKTALLHGVKDDAARHAIVAKLRGDDGARGYPQGGNCLEPPIDRNRQVLNVQVKPSKLNVISSANDRLVSMEDLRGAFHGKRVFLIANGPSLKKTDLRKIAGEYTIGLNRIYLNYENMGFEPTFYCCVNAHVLEQFADDIDRLNSVKFLSSNGRRFFKREWNTFFLGSAPNIGFSRNLSPLLWHEGWTVTYCGMQLAYHLGFDEVVLVGLDHYFGNTGEANKAVTAQGEDVNHFHKDYFGKGVVWQFPDLARSEQHYHFAKQEFERLGRRIVDATIGGHLQIFPKVDYADCFRAADAAGTNAPMTVEDVAPMVSVIMPAKNAAPYIGQAIQSVLEEQDFRDLELIVVIDSGCDEATSLVASNLSRRDRRVKVVANARAPGVSGSRNTAIDLAKGQFICFLDADDYWLPNSLSSRITAMAERPDFGMVHSYTQFVDVDERPLEIGVGIKSDVTFVNTYHNPAHLNTCLVRASALKGLRFSETLTNGEDWMFLAQLLRQGIKSGYVEKGQAVYRITPDSTVMKDFFRHEALLDSVLDFVFSPTQDGNTPESLRAALKSPTRAHVKQGRRLNVLTWAILSGDRSAASEIVGELSKAGYWADAKTDTIVATMRAVATRFFAVRPDQFATVVRPFANKIDAALVASGLAIVAPAIESGLRALLGLPTAFSSPPKQVAPLEGLIIGAHAAKFESHSLERESKGQIDECGLVFHVVEGGAHPGVMIDVGAHFGGSLHRFAQAGWTVYAFEPDPANREKLIAGHGMQPKVTVSDQAVSDRAGLEVPFYSSDESTGISGLSAFRETHREVARVKTVTLNDVIARHCITKIDFLKIDVEGFEMAVLRGLDFTKIMPEVVLAEYENDKTEAQGYDVYDLCKFLTNLSYTVYVSEWYPIERYGAKHSFRRIIRYPCDVPPTSWGNLIAFRTDPEPDMLKAAIQSALDKPITFVGDPIKPAIKPPGQTALRFMALSDFTAAWNALPGNPLELSEAVREVDTDAGVAIEFGGKLGVLGLRQTFSLAPGKRIAVRHKGRLAQAHTNSSRRASFLVLARAFDAWNVYLGAFPLGFQPAQANWTERNFELSADDVLKAMPGVVKVRLTVSHNWIDDSSVGNSGNGRSQSVLFTAEQLAETAAAVAIADTKSESPVSIATTTPIPLAPSALLAAQWLPPAPYKASRWPIAVGILGTALLIGSATAAALTLPGGLLRPGLLYPLLPIAAAGLLTSLVSVGILLRQRDLRRRGSKIESMRASLFTVSDRNSRGPLRNIAASGLFNGQWYLAQNPDVVQAKVDPLLHYVKHGASEGRPPCPYFDPHWYLAKNPDVASSGVEPLSHYLTHGWRENRDPIPLFNTAWYLRENPDVAASGTEPLTHYIRTGWREGRNPCPLFKSTWYLAQNPDVHRAGLEPLAHYLSAGWREGRSPNPLFKPLWYTGQNPDVAQAGVEPLAHFIGSGWQEGRSPHPAFPRALAEFGLNAKHKPSWNEIEAVFDFMFKNSDALQSVFWPMRDGYDALAAKVAGAEKRLAEIAVAGNSTSARIEERASGMHHALAAKVANAEKRLAEIAAADKAASKRIEERASALQQELAAKIAAADKRIAEVAAADKRLQEEFAAKIAAAAKAATDMIEANTAKLQQEAAAKIAAADKRIAEVATTGKVLGERIESLTAKSQADHQSLQGSVTNLGHRLETSLSEVAQRAAELRDDLVEKLQVNEKHTQEVGGQVKDGLNSLKSLVDAGRAEQAKLQATATAVEARALATAASLSRMNASNAAAARPHTRLLDGPSMERVFNHWLPTFGLSMKKSAIAYFAHRMCLAEDQCEGRFATTIQAMILRLLAMRSLGPATQIKVLEIGTLFGLGSAFFHMFRGPDIGRVKLTIIDPLSGYYSEGQLDMITGVPITLETLQSNLARLNIPAEDVRILQGQSQDQAIRRQAATSRYDLILIDGDHSREGVRRDYEMYAPLLEPGGIILFDDYDTPEWPEIKDTVDRIMANATGLKWIGNEWRTGIAKSTVERGDLRLPPERAESTRKPKRGQKNRTSR